ncbi:unnamed protein product [Thelazia callipaeda]|uniref:C3H1-type domain-containing protein n=1 Tax=Thelazia callipaeda TaxID=103827 RepID=A0A0N5DAQ4_THECL|nr:unnamed protein product [Thelazia callipaeda]
MLVVGACMICYQWEESELVCQVEETQSGRQTSRNEVLISNTMEPTIALCNCRQYRKSVVGQPPSRRSQAILLYASEVVGSRFQTYILIFPMSWFIVLVELLVPYREGSRTVGLSAFRPYIFGSIPNIAGDDNEGAKTESMFSLVVPPATQVVSPLQAPLSVIVYLDSFAFTISIYQLFLDFLVILCDSYTVIHPRMEWQKIISDRERQFLLRERRRMGSYKTSLCDSFRNNGECHYGQQCRFAHGYAELRPTPRPHPKYKTQLCNKFALYGSCPYGFRCQFIHMRSSEVGCEQLGLVNFAASLDGHSYYSQYFASRRRVESRRLRRDVEVLESEASIGDIPKKLWDSVGITEESNIVRHPILGTDNASQQSSEFALRCNYCASERLEHASSSNLKDLEDGPGSSQVGNNVSVLDHMLSTLTVTETSTPFTQSCFPRINVESRSTGSLVMRGNIC